MPEVRGTRTPQLPPGHTLHVLGAVHQPQGQPLAVAGDRTGNLRVHKLHTPAQRLGRGAGCDLDSWKHSPTPGSHGLPGDKP